MSAAFGNHKKHKKMPKDVWVLKKIATSEYMSVYASDPDEATWVAQPLAAKHYDTQAEVNSDITSWGETPGVNYIGSNPQNPPQ
jgi:hypothetical protein